MTASTSVNANVLPGVALRRLQSHRDERGTFTEIFRDEWGLGLDPMRWELIQLAAGETREVGPGVFVALDGRVRLDCDGGELLLDASAPAALVVAPGVTARAHADGAPVALVHGLEGHATAPGLTRHDLALPPGVEMVDLPLAARSTTLYDAAWGMSVGPVQWNAVRSRAGVLRGVHCHLRHADLLCVTEGRMRLALADLRGEAPEATCIDLVAERPQMIAIPPGVAHGFLFLEPSLHIYAVDRTWDVSDELGCRWDDPELAVGWGAEPERISPRDHALGSLAELREALAL